MVLFASRHCYAKVFVVVTVQSPSCVRFFAIPWTAAHQAPQSPTISQSLPKFMTIESGMPSNHLILWCPLLLWSLSIHRKIAEILYGSWNSAQCYVASWTGGELGGEWMHVLEKEIAAHSSILVWEIHGQRSLAGYRFPGSSKKKKITEKKCQFSKHTTIFTPVSQSHWRKHTGQKHSLVERVSRQVCDAHKQISLTIRRAEAGLLARSV